MAGTFQSNPTHRFCYRALIASVTPRPLFKLFTTYSDPWWLAAGVEKGRTVTDLPVRQTYYWPTNQGDPAMSGPAMLMASYDDGQNIGFWDGLRPRRRQAWSAGQEVAEPADPFLGHTDDRARDLAWHQYKAPRGMVDEVARQLAVIHGLPYTPEVRNAAFRDWGDDPFGGGWNSWNIGVKSWEVQQRIVRPLDDRPLYICGEAYSDAQGWVEGALQTADAMLAHFGIAPL
jgi:monoamine oxidase